MRDGNAEERGGLGRRFARWWRHKLRRGEALDEHSEDAEGAEIAAMAAGWCEFQRTFGTSPEWQRRRAAAERLDGLCEQDPERAWAVLLEIVRIEIDHDILGTLAGGPLARLLVAHGSRWIDVVESRARSDAKLRGLLARCSPEALEPEVWRRLLEVSGRASTS